MKSLIRNHTILFLSLVYLVTPSHSEHFTQAKNDWISRVLISLDKVIEFFFRDYDSVNLDGIFGLRVAEGMYLGVNH